jgi:hypothetical protein
MAKHGVSEKTQAARNSTAIYVGDWSVYLFDSENWALQKTGDDPRYYPTRLWALKALLHERISEAQAESIKEVLAAVKNAEVEITSAVQRLERSSR